MKYKLLFLLACSLSMCLCQEAVEEQVVQAQRNDEPVSGADENREQENVTPGEEIIARPEKHATVPCMGCVTYINPSVEGVSELADYGIRHLNLHEPDVKHRLESVIEVERQVQIVNGVRYILTMVVDYDNCTEDAIEGCAFSKTCKISVLVKPWRTLPSGSKYKSILANNCTEEWLFGDNGEVLPEPVNQNQNNNGDDIIQAKKELDVQAQPNVQRTLSFDEIKAIEEQIVKSEVQETGDRTETSSPDDVISKEHVSKSESVQRNDNSIPEADNKHEVIGLSDEKKKDIDDMLNILFFSNLKPRGRETETP